MRPTRRPLFATAAVAVLALLAPNTGSAQTFDLDLVGQVPVPDTSCTIGAITPDDGINTSFTPQGNSSGRADIQLADANGRGQVFALALDLSVNCGVPWQASITSREDGLLNSNAGEPVFINYSATIVGGPVSSSSFVTSQGTNPGRSASFDFDETDSEFQLFISGLQSGPQPGALLVPGSYSDTVSLVIRPR